jgi:putative exosortase-associated protein (TIGR04073 family)
MKRPVYQLMLISFVCLLCGTAYGADQNPPGQVHGIQRLGRGVANTISSPLELLAQPVARAKYWDERSNNQFAVLGGFFEGIPMGFVYFGWRLGAGFYDMFTFPFWCYDTCIIQPEYLSFSPEFLEPGD